MMRTHTCGELRPADAGKPATLCGWVATRRDHGGVLFLDLRDRYGMTQATSRAERDAALYEKARRLPLEGVVAITGAVEARPADKANPKLPTGGVELSGSRLEILNDCPSLPFEISDAPISNELRLEHRYLDLRRPRMQRNLAARHRLMMAVRKSLDAEGFVEVETPILYKSTPEGAREYLVPSRVHRGQFYALPMSPQVFKQLCMVAGFDRYFQIARCFRDEDLRADRQPEFTQIDIETSFLAESEIRAIMERLIRTVFKQALGLDLPEPFPVMLYAEAMARYGSDKPDLRVPLEFTELTDVMKGVEFKVFSAPANAAGGRVAGLRIPGGGSLTRGEIDAYTQFVGIYGARGLAYMKVNETARGREGLQSPIVKNLSDAALDAIVRRSGAKDGDLIFFAADKAKIVNDALGALRVKIGHEKGYAVAGWKPLWVVDFPMFEYDDDAKRWVAMHHPFTAPKDGHEDYLARDPSKAVAKAYDMVLNGSEIGGGSVRIHREEVQSKVFRALAIGPEEAQLKFGFLLDALRYGAPPHGGIAFGLDRIVAMMAGTESIRDVIAFPKTQRAQCLLTQAPSPVDEKQLRELHIRLRNLDRPTDKK